MPETTTKRKYKRLSEEEIERAYSLLEKGITTSVVAQNIGVSVASIYKLVNAGKLAQTNGDGEHEKSKTISMETKVKTTENGTTALVLKLKSQYEKFQSKLEFHKGKAEEYENKIEQFKEIISETFKQN